MKINKIEKNTYQGDWSKLLDDFVEFSSTKHRRNSNFYVTSIYEIGPEQTEDEELHGFWETNTYVHDMEYGSDDVPDTLFRVEKNTRTITIEEWKRIM